MEALGAVMGKLNNREATVEVLYKALMHGDTQSVAGLLASDLEWWFHGPPGCQHMMRVLTGESSYFSAFKFEPRSITAVDERVIVEGWEGEQAYWVHVWSVNEGGLITQFREYFNTWLTVRDLKSSCGGASRQVLWEEMKNHGRNTLWQSITSEQLTRSLPGIVLAI